MFSLQRQLNFLFILSEIILPKYAAPEKFHPVPPSPLKPANFISQIHNARLYLEAYAFIYFFIFGWHQCFGF